MQTYSISVNEISIHPLTKEKLRVVNDSSLSFAFDTLIFKICLL